MLSIEWRNQEELLDSFVNLEEYGKLLFYLETSLFTNSPRFLCPSSFIIKVLFTLCTIEDFYNADLMHRADLGHNTFRYTISDMSFSGRAYQILRQIYELVRHPNQSNIDTNDPFAPVRYDRSDLEFAKKQLISALDFVNDRPKTYELRRRKVKTNYKELGVTDLPPEINSTPKKQVRTECTLSDDDPNKWSPERRRMEKEFSEFVDTSASNEFGSKLQSTDDESDTDLVKTAERKTAKILKNERIDIALAQEGIWFAIQWCLECAIDRTDLLSYKSWEMWNRILNLMVDIFNLEFDDYIKGTNRGEQKRFEDTLVFKFLLNVGRYNWNQNLPERLLKNPKGSASPVYPNEKTKSKSVRIERVLEEPDHALQVSSRSSTLIRKVFFMSCIACRHRNYDIADSERSKWHFDKLIESFVLILRDLNHHDLINFCQFEVDDLRDLTVCQAIEELLSFYLDQITTYSFTQPLGWEWITDHEQSFLTDLFRNVSFSRKSYHLESDEGLEKILDDYNKMNLLLYYMFKLWCFCSNVELSESERVSLMKNAKVGQDTRMRVLQSAYGKNNEIPEDGLKQLTVLLQNDI